MLIWFTLLIYGEGFLLAIGLAKLDSEPYCRYGSESPQIAPSLSVSATACVSNTRQLGNRTGLVFNPPVLNPDGHPTTTTVLQIRGIFSTVAQQAKQPASQLAQRPSNESPIALQFNRPNGQVARLPRRRGAGGGFALPGRRAAT